MCLWLTFALLLQGGCVVGTRAPEVSISGVSLGEQSDEAYVLHIDLVLANPNDVPLQLQEVVYDLVVNGRQAYSGRRSAEATLKAGGEKTLPVPAVVRVHGDPGASAIGPVATSPSSSSFHPDANGIDYSVRGRIWYRTPETLAEALFDAKLYRPSTSFRAEGRLIFTDEQ